MKSSKSGTRRSNHRTIEVYSAAQMAVARNNLLSSYTHSGNLRRSQHPTPRSDTIPGSGGSSPLKNTTTYADDELRSQHLRNEPGSWGSSPPKNTTAYAGDEPRSQHPRNDLSSQYTIPSPGDSSPSRIRSGNLVRRPGNKPPKPPSQHPIPRWKNGLSSQHKIPRRGCSSPSKNTRTHSGSEPPSQYTGLSSGSGLGPLIHELPGNDLDLHKSIPELDSPSFVTESARSLPSPVETGTNSASKNELPFQRPPDVSTAEYPYGIMRLVLNP